MDPIVSVDWLSVSGTQFVPPLTVFQTPPPAVATYRMLGFVGSPATPVMRPETTPPPGVWPFKIGAGPSGIHVEVLSGMDVERTRRSSSDSIARRRRSCLARVDVPGRDLGARSPRRESIL